MTPYFWPTVPLRSFRVLVRWRLRRSRHRILTVIIRPYAVYDTACSPTKCSIPMRTKMGPIFAQCPIRFGREVAYALVMYHKYLFTTYIESCSHSTMYCIYSKDGNAEICWFWIGHFTESFTRTFLLPQSARGVYPTSFCVIFLEVRRKRHLRWDLPSTLWLCF